MDVLEFINSTAVKEHLKSLNYKFNALEAAWLVYQSHNHTYIEKKKAWLEIIKTMPDCKVPETAKRKEYDSLHELLRQYMIAVEKVEMIVYKEEKPGTSVYRLDEFAWISDYWYDDSGIFANISDCLKGIENDINFGAEFRITKQYFFGDKETYTIELDSDLNFAGVHDLSQESEYYDIIKNTFEGMSFKFPIPFKKGDIVNRKDSVHYDCFDYTNQPLILLDISAFGEEENTNSMSAYVLVREFQTNQIIQMKIENYMNLEFYNENLHYIEKTFPVISDYINAKYDFTTFLYEYRNRCKEGMTS